MLTIKNRKAGVPNFSVPLLSNDIRYNLIDLILFPFLQAERDPP